MGAANAGRTGAPATSQATGNPTPPVTQETPDRTFVFHLPQLSVDFMSYTSLAMSGQNKTALLDPETLANVSSSVFSLFFKNFAQATANANDALFIDGAWGFQTIGATIPSDLGSVIGSNPPLLLQGSLSPSPTGPGATSSGVLSTVVETVDMNHTVAILSLSILSIFIVTMAFLIVYRHQYLKDFPRDMDTIGSVLGLLYGSERLLRLANQSDGNAERGTQREMLKLGWFDVGQKRRWGVEVVRPGDRFSKEYLSTEKGFKEIRISN